MGRAARRAWIGTVAIALSFASSIGALITLEDRGEEERQVVTVAWDYANTVGVDAQLSLLLDPLSIFMALAVSGVSTLIHLYSVSYMALGPRLHALLRVPELLRLLDAAAGPGRQLPAS